MHNNPDFDDLIYECFSTESMTMTKTHKDIALFMVQLTERSGFTERDVMQEISRKTKDLIETLRSVQKYYRPPGSAVRTN
jgi:hypothetical protein